MMSLTEIAKILEYSRSKNLKDRIRSMLPAMLESGDAKLGTKLIPVFDIACPVDEYWFTERGALQIAIRSGSKNATKYALQLSTRFSSMKSQPPPPKHYTSNTLPPYVVKTHTQLLAEGDNNCFEGRVGAVIVDGEKLNIYVHRRPHEERESIAQRLRRREMEIGCTEEAESEFPEVE
jgi:hypothetical protein